MLDITCYCGRLRPQLDVPFSLSLAGRSIGEYFRYGSMDQNGVPDINLQIDTTSRYNNSIIPDERPTTAFYLQYALMRLTQNPLNTNKVNNIGLILADRFESRPGVLGFMFDLGFNPSGIDPVNSIYTDVPREGCAIFLNAIRQIRPSDDAFSKETVFTSIHELGHVFNLWHLENPKTFMATSNNITLYPETAYYFHKSHRDYLHQASVNSHVWPGGSHFDERTIADPSFNNPFTVKDSQRKLTLKIKIDQPEFWYFEPIEMDIKILSSSKLSTVLPDKVDPGYEEFSIYITKPDGTIFKYKPPRIYCQNSASIKITSQKPFSRDISIFGQSGGYTFREPGIYKIQCFFKYGKGDKILASNVEEVYIKNPMLNNNKFINFQKIFTNQQAGRFLYHRSGFYDQVILNELEEFYERNSKSLSGINVLYAMSRFHMHVNKKLTVKMNEKIYSQVHKALNSGKLSKQREKNLLTISQKYF